VVVGSQWAAMMEFVDRSFTVRVSGEIDASSAGRLREYLSGAVSMAHGQVTIDLRGVEFLDSSAIHALLTARDAAEERDVQLIVQAEGLPLRVIELTGLAFLLAEQAEPAT
jgi:anti-sigma B factor antagonist